MRRINGLPNSIPAILKSLNPGSDVCPSCESAELLELFLWKDEEKVNVEKVKEELADVFYSALLLAHKYQLDVDEIVSAKVRLNEEKYPVLTLLTHKPDPATPWLPDVQCA